MNETAEDYTHYLVLAGREYDRRNLDVAISYYTRTLKFQHGNEILASIYYTLGSCSYFKHDYKRAILKFKKATALFPKHFRSYNAWGSCLSNMEKYEEAIEKFKAATELNEEYTLAQLNWVLVLFLQGKEEEAGKIFEEIQLWGSGFGWYAKIYKEEVEILEASIVKRKTDKEKKAAKKRIESIHHLLELIQSRIKIEEAEMQ